MFAGCSANRIAANPSVALGAANPIKNQLKSLPISSFFPEVFPFKNAFKKRNPQTPSPIARSIKDIAVVVIIILELYGISQFYETIFLI